MPAAAVIPAPIAYIKVVAVKKLVVGFRGGATGLPMGMHWSARPSFRRLVSFFIEGFDGSGSFTLKKLECSKQAYALNRLAWNNRIGLWFYFVGF